MKRGNRGAMGLLACACVAAALAGCESLPNPPLVFAQSQTVGVTIAGSPASQGGEFTVGYRDWNLAVVPVTVTQGDGQVTSLTASANPGKDQKFEDAFSTLGQFDVNVEGGTSNKVGLGKFFATGLAAKVLADGFAASMSKPAAGQK